MIGRSALLSDSLPWSSDKTGRNPCGPVAIRIRQREFWSIRYHEPIVQSDLSKVDDFIPQNMKDDFRGIINVRHLHLVLMLMLPMPLFPYDTGIRA